LADPNTPNVALLIPTRGSDVGTWDVPVNGDFSAIDGFFGGVQTISVAASPVTLTAPAGAVTPSGGPTQAQNAVLKFTGTVTASVVVTLPLPGYYIIDTSGLSVSSSFPIILRAVSVGEVIGMPFGSVRHVYSDGTNVRFVNLQEVGTYVDFAGSSVPSWITSCTKPPFLNCDGSVFSAVTYPFLAALIGTTLPDARGRGRAALNQGTSRMTTAGGGVDGNTPLAAGGAETKNLIATQLPGLATAGTSNITVDVPNSGAVPVAITTLGSNILTNPGTPTSGGVVSPYSPPGTTWTGTSTLSRSQVIAGLVTGTGAGGAGTGAAGPSAVVQPTYIGGITMIRAA